MKINKNKLQNALELVKPGLANKEMIEQSTSFAFLKGKVVTYNDEISISHPIEEIELEGAIQAEELYKLLGKIKKEEIELTIKDNEVFLKAGRIEAGVSLQEKITLPFTDEIKVQNEWELLPEHFIEALQFTVVSCSVDMSKPVLTCVHVDQRGIIESSDNFRLAKYTLSESFDFESFLIPASSVLQVIKLKPIKIAKGKGWVHFQTKEKTVISCRILEDKYPNTISFYNVKGMTFDFPQKTLEGLEKAHIFAKRDYTLDETINITIADKKLTISSKSTFGWYKESLNIRYSAKPITFSITPYLLKDILNKTNTCQINDKMLKFAKNEWEYVSTLRETE